MKWVVIAVFLVVLAIFANASTPKPSGNQSIEGETNFHTISSCATLNASGYYFLEDDLLATSSPCLIISSNDIWVNCLSNTLIGNRSNTGVQIQNSSNVTIFNCRIKNFDTAIIMNNSNVNMSYSLVSSNNLGINVTQGTLGLSYNSINNNSNYNLVGIGGTFNLPYNFWGSLLEQEIRQTIIGNVSFDPFLTDDPYKDIDHDSIPNLFDNCIFDPNDDQLDADFDGKGDACDINLMLSIGSFDPLNEPIPMIPGFNTSSDNGYYIVQFFTKPSISDIVSLESRGANVIAEIEQNAVVIGINPPSKNLVKSLPRVRYMDIYQPVYKLSSEIVYELRKNGTEFIDPVSNLSILIGGPKAYMELYIYVFKDILKVRNDLIALGAENVVDLGGFLSADIYTDLLEGIALIPEVSLIQERPVYEIKNNIATGDNNGNGILEVGGIPRSVLGLTGRNQIVAVMDTGFDNGQNDATLHADFRNRVIAHYGYGRPGAAANPLVDSWNDTDGHGSHVAGSVLGNGLAFSGNIANIVNGRIRAGAYESGLVTQSVVDSDGGLGGIPADLRTGLQDAKNSGATIQTNSWGAGCVTTYTQQAFEMDDFLYKNPEFTILVANGNERGQCPNGGPPFNPPEIGSPAVAKNIISVGATENLRPTLGANSNNINDRAGFSSRGPVTPNLRLKPDITAPGTNILSVRSSICRPHQPPFRAFSPPRLQNIVTFTADGSRYSINSNAVLYPIAFNQPTLADYAGVTFTPVGASPAISAAKANFLRNYMFNIDLNNNDVIVGGPGAYANQDFTAKDSDGSGVLDHPDCTGWGLTGNAALDPLYMYMGGTSMATPLTAGLVALVRQFYMEKMGTLPSGALLKATIINGGVDVGVGFNSPGSTGVNDQGWGRANLTKSIAPCGELGGKLYQCVHFLNSTKLDGTNRQYSRILRFSKDYPIEATLVWTDPPRTTAIAVAATGSLSNDLDLKTNGIGSGIAYSGNVFNAGSDDSTQNPGAAKDNTNPVERVRIQNPGDGFYNISILAASFLATGPGFQDFALVVSGIRGIDTTNLAGEYKYSFSLKEDIYATAVGLPNGTEVWVYILDHTHSFNAQILDLKSKDKSERGDKLVVTTSGKGTLNQKVWVTSKTAAKIIQDFPTNQGQYHVVIDVNKNNNFDLGIDLVDYHDKAGFQILCGSESNDHTCAAIESSTSSGIIENFFNRPDSVYAKTTILSLNKTRTSKFYAVKFGDAKEDALLKDITGPGSGSSPENQNVPLNAVVNTNKLIWSPELVGGDYDLVLDVDGNGKYNSSIDVVDPDGFTVLDVIEQPRFAIDSSNVLHAVAIQGGKTTKLLYGFSKLNEFRIDKKHPESIEWSKDNSMTWKVLRESGRNSYRAPDITVDSGGNPFIITETHVSEFDWLLFLALNGTSGKLNYDFDKDSPADGGNPTDVLFYYWDDFWDPQMTDPRIEIDPSTDMPVVSSKVFLFYPDVFYFTQIYPSSFLKLTPMTITLPLVPVFYMLEAKGGPAMFYGDSLQVATYAHGGKEGDGLIKWPPLWNNHIDLYTGEESFSGRSFAIADGEQAKVLDDVATASPRHGEWFWSPVDESHGLSSPIGNGDLAIDKDGGIHVVYYRKENKKDPFSKNIVFYSKLDNVKDNSTGIAKSKVESFTRPIKLSTKVAVNNIFTPAIDVDQSKVAHIVWQGPGKINYARIKADLVAGSTAPSFKEKDINIIDFFEKEEVAKLIDTTHSNSRPDIVVDGKGEPRIIYKDKDNVNPSRNSIYQIKINSSVPAFDFSKPIAVVKATDYTLDPQISHNTLEINKYSSTFFPETYLGWTEVLDTSRSMKYKKTLPHLTFLVMIDGMDSAKFNQLLSSGKLPNIKKLMDDGKLQGDATTTFPESTFSTYTSIMTGLYPKNHQVPGDRFKDGGTQKNFITDPNTVNAHLTSKNVKTVFDYLKEGGYSSAAVASIYSKGIPASDPNKIVPASVNFNTGSVSNFNDLITYLDGLDERDNQFSNDAADFISVYLLTQDHGLNKNPSAMDFTLADTQFGKIVAKLKDKGALDSSMFIITSDHGFKDVAKSTNNIVADVFVSATSKTYFLETNGEAAFHYVTNPADVNAVAGELNALKNGGAHSTLPSTDIHGKINKEYVKNSGTYKEYPGLANAAQNIKDSVSAASGDVLLTIKDPYYFSKVPKESIEFSTQRKVPVVVTGKFYKTLMNNSYKLSETVSVIDIMKTALYGVGGKGLADNALVDGKHLFADELLVKVGSPVNLHLYDSSGNHVGFLPDGSLESTIPLSEFNFDNRSKQTQIGLLQAPDVYRVLVEAYGPGHFTLDIIKTRFNDSFSLSFPTIDITESSRAIVDLSEENPSMQFDIEGDGSFETLVTPDSFSKVEQNEDSIVVHFSALQGSHFTIDLLGTFGVRIEGTALADITDGTFEISKILNPFDNELFMDNAIQIVSSLGAVQNNNLSLTIKYSDVDLGPLSEDNIAIYRIETAPEFIESSNDPVANEFADIHGVGVFAISAQDINPIINDIIVVPSISKVANDNLLLLVNTTDNNAIESVSANFLGSNYELIFNPLSGLYEVSLIGPSLDGVYMFDVNVIDNNENEQSASYANFILDTTAPNVTITYPLTAQVIKNNSITFKYSSDANVANATLNLDGSQTDLELPLVNFVELNLSFGPHLAFISSYDDAANLGVSNIVSFEIPKDNIELSSIDVPAIAKPGEELEILFEARNTGDDLETAEFFLLEDNLPVKYLNLTIGSRQNIFAQFEYTAISGKHNLSVVTSPVAGETYLEDNTLSSSIFVSNKTIALLVDDSPDSDSSTYVYSLINSGLDVLEESSSNVDFSKIDDFKLVVWFTGDLGNINFDEINLLNEFTNFGGSLIVSGEDIGANFEENSAFDLFGVKWIGKNEFKNVAGIPGDVIGRGLLLDMAGGESMQAISGKSIPIFNFIGGGIAGVRIENLGSKIVYFSFGLEDIVNPSERNTVITRTISYLNIDDFAPKIVNLNPEDKEGLSINSTSVILNLTTDEFSQCRFSYAPMRFNSMQIFDSTNSTLHSVFIEGLSNGLTKTLFIKCRDGKNNVVPFTHGIFVYNRTFLSPVLEDITDKTTFENSTFILPINVYDPENDPFSIKMEDVLSVNFPKPIASRIQVTNSTLRLSLNFEDGGEYRLKVVANDSTSIVSDEFILTVINVNRKPVIEFIPAINSVEDSFFNFTVIASDPDRDAVTFNDNSTLLNINSFTGTVGFTPRQESIGTHVINFTVGDGSLEESKVVIASVAPSNDAPVINFVSPQYATSLFNFNLQIDSYDPDGDSLTFFDNTSMFNISSTGLINFTPLFSDAGVYIIEILASDGITSTSKLLNLIIQSVNQAPIIRNITRQVTVVQNKTTNISVIACDPDLDPLCG